MMRIKGEHVFATKSETFAERKTSESWSSKNNLGIYVSRFVDFIEHA